MAGKECDWRLCDVEVSAEWVLAGLKSDDRDDAGLDVANTELTCDIGVAAPCVSLLLRSPCAVDEA